MTALPRILQGALSAEWLKLRGTLALRLCGIAPAVVVTLCVLQFGITDLKGRDLAPDAAWRAFGTACLGLWAFLMVPLLVTLEAALLAGLEHGDRQWKHLLALPIPRFVHYLAKAIVLVALLLLTSLAIVPLTALGGWALMHLHPEGGLAGWPPWWFLLRTSLGVMAGALLAAAIQLWVAVRWPSFTVAVATGMSATVAGFMIGQSKEYGHWYPWSMPVQFLARDGVHASFVIAASLSGALLVLAFGLWRFSRREFN